MIFMFVVLWPGCGPVVVRLWPICGSLFRGRRAGAVLLMSLHPKQNRNRHIAAQFSPFKRCNFQRLRMELEMDCLLSKGVKASDEEGVRHV